MKALAVKYREYILNCHAFRSSSNGAITQELRQAYIRETGRSLGHCGSCFINQVIPEYIKIINESNA